MRSATIERETRETQITLRLELDGSGLGRRKTGVGFLDHMLDLFAFHAGFDLDVQCQGDTWVDGHHTVEDVGIALGQALDRCLGSRAGIARYGSVLLPMDEALAQIALDVSGRALLVWDADLPAARVGDFDTELAREFFQALTRTLGLTLHVRLLSGYNTHHMLEAIFKGAGRALGQAVAVSAKDPLGIPSTKGSIGEGGL